MKITTAKIVSEYDQEISQSQTADKPIAPRGRATQQSPDIRNTQISKQVNVTRNAILTDHRPTHCTTRKRPNEHE